MYLKDKKSLPQDLISSPQSWGPRCELTGDPHENGASIDVIRDTCVTAASQCLLSLGTSSPHKSLLVPLDIIFLDFFFHITKLITFPLWFGKNLFGVSVTYFHCFGHCLISSSRTQFLEKKIESMTL